MREGTHLQKTAKAWEKTEGYSVGYERAGEQDMKTCKGFKKLPSGVNMSAGAGVFAIKNIRIDAGSSSVGQKKTSRLGQLGRARMLWARLDAFALFLLIYLRV